MLQEARRSECSKSKKIQPWNQQITIRGITTSVLIGVIYTDSEEVGSTTGLIPNLNNSVALLAVVFLKSWTELLQKTGFVTTPFTKQESTVFQTCAVASYRIAF